MSELIDKYQELAIELLEAERNEDAKVLLSVVGEFAIAKVMKVPEVKLDKFKEE